MTAVTSPPSAVLDALRTVRDPELDESVVDLGFVTSSTVDGRHAEVRLRLPTYWCAPNFAYLMVADAFDAVRAVSGIESVSIRLEDHFASDAINSGVAAGAGFVGSFPDEAESELDDLRRNFQCKAHVAAMERACRRLLADGWTIESLPQARLADLPDGAERERLLRRRADIDLPADPGSLVLVGDDGAPVAADEVPLRLRFARTVRVSIDGNAHFCRGLLATRYAADPAQEEPS